MVKVELSAATRSAESAATAIKERIVKRLCVVVVVLVVVIELTSVKSENGVSKCAE